MKFFPLIVAALFLFSLASCKEPPPRLGRYQLVRATEAGMMLKIDTFTGDVWRITPAGEQTLVSPPGPMDSVEDVRELHAYAVKEGKTKLNLRDLAIEMKRVTESSRFDAVLIEQQRETK